MSMKIGLVTLDSRTFNYGGQLQQFALYSILNQLPDANCEIIDYGFRSEEVLFSIHRSFKNITFHHLINMFGGNKIKKLTPEKIVAVRDRHTAFMAFRESNIKYTEKCTEKNIGDIARKFDALVCGSDQIWNPNFCSPALFLDFALPSQKCLIYGASISRDNLLKREQKIIKPYLLKLRNITAREERTAQLVESIIGKNESIKVVLDPTMLYSGKDWIEMFNLKKNNAQKYVFCYFMNPDSEVEKTIIRISKKNNIKIYNIPYLLEYDNEPNGLNYADKSFTSAGPIEFLNLIYNAEWVITDSFHASVFSILFHINFVTCGRMLGGKSQNTRINTLLDTVGLSERLVKPDTIRTILNKKINWDSTDQMLENKRKKDRLIFNMILQSSVN